MAAYHFLRSLLTVNLPQKYASAGKNRLHHSDKLLTQSECGMILVLDTVIKCGLPHLQEGHWNDAFVGYLIK